MFWTLGFVLDFAVCVWRVQFFYILSFAFYAFPIAVCGCVYYLVLAICGWCYAFDVLRSPFYGWSFVVGILQLIFGGCLAISFCK